MQQDVVDGRADFFFEMFCAISTLLHSLNMREDLIDKLHKSFYYYIKNTNILQ